LLRSYRELILRFGLERPQAGYKGSALGFFLVAPGAATYVFVHFDVFTNHMRIQVENYHLFSALAKSSGTSRIEVHL
jgi:hypothetical protein